ncbi:YjbE family putative metal transport protein [Bacillus dakarensis]|uniref:YjbE family putative metal transport protein n=1 Tax=Robertmurraya dakarensis TaxID=1926278 RepID=UPI0009808E7A|nr:YjbE family putative metal transport protein [Bacillus dakarensis]
MTLLQILSLVGIDILLSGDNAVIIALAARNVPKHLQRKVIFYGMLGAIVLRIIAATVIIQFLEYPFVQAVGGIILLRIAYHLIVQKNEEQTNIKSSDRVWGAIKIIAISDLAMSIDNVIALTSVAKGITPIIFGILISIPIIIVGSRFLLVWMEKYPIIIYVGAGLLSYAAGKMIIEDSGLASYISTLTPFYLTALPIVMAILLVAAGYVRNSIKEVNITL